MKDLFEHYETLPQEVQDVLEKHATDDDTYENCQQLVEDLNKVGYTCDYYLDAVPFNLRKLERPKLSYEDMAHLAWALKNQH